MSNCFFLSVHFNSILNFFYKRVFEADADVAKKFPSAQDAAVSCQVCFGTLVSFSENQAVSLSGIFVFFFLFLHGVFVVQDFSQYSLLSSPFCWHIRTGSRLLFPFQRARQRGVFPFVLRDADGDHQDHFLAAAGAEEEEHRSAR